MENAVMKLNELKPPEGSTHSRKRLGRGIGSGHGKTAGRGSKGQLSRAGGSSHPWFEGGQMPIQRRLPIRGFKNIFKKEYAIVNLNVLNNFQDGTIVNPELLLSSGIVKQLKIGVKILGNGELDKSLTVEAHSFSKSALDKIKNAGGTAKVISKQ
jgi:large subunit ribosomal protein L15